MNFPSYGSWICEHGHDIEREWELIHDEYGDASPLLSDFKYQRWQEAEKKQEEMNQ